MTFPEWLYNMYRDDGMESIEDARGYVELMADWLLKEPHYGDCTNQNITCKICLFQTHLDEYETYCREKLKGQ